MKWLFNGFGWSYIIELKFDLFYETTNPSEEVLVSRKVTKLKDSILNDFLFQSSKLVIKRGSFSKQNSSAFSGNKAASLRSTVSITTMVQNYMCVKSKQEAAVVVAAEMKAPGIFLPNLGTTTTTTSLRRRSSLAFRRRREKDPTQDFT